MTRMRELRERAKMTQSDLAKKMGVDRSLVSRWENSERKISLVDAIRIAGFIKCKVTDLASSLPVLSRPVESNSREERPE